ncbi:hypothetical protein [Mycoplasmopsis synoviae]|uniref:Uncharacterized protein n=1 Tax=Mycoplasmopsis synoviae TaxID=2109 RepID=A0A3B0PST4_MYCSY|nr:hypothetical protein [Mycoplasmopsis synoviae]SYV92751.1 Uncharacterised protein [Mycoplasmopsis synoviae]
MSEEAAAEAETQTPAAPMADLASTVSYLKSLSDSLKAETDKLNGDTTENKTAYIKLILLVHYTETGLCLK